MDFIEHKVFELEGTSEISSSRPLISQRGKQAQTVYATRLGSVSKPGTQLGPLPSGTTPSQGPLSLDRRQLNSLGLSSWEVL